MVAEMMPRRRATLHSKIERPPPLVFVRKGSAGAAGGRSAAANPPPPPRNTQSVFEYHQIFAKLKSSDPTTPAGVLHQQTMTKIASLRAEEEARHAELRASQNGTRLNRLVRGVTGLTARGGAGPQLNGSDRSHDNASPKELSGTPASTPVLRNGRRTFKGRPTLLGMPGLNGAVSRVGGFLPGNGGRREASGKGNLAPKKSDDNLIGNDDQSKGDVNSASAMSDITGFSLDETDNSVDNDDEGEEEDPMSRSARHHELDQLIRASRTGQSSSPSSAGSISSPTPNNKGPTPNEVGASVLQKMIKLQKDELMVVARSPSLPGLRRRRRYSTTAVLAEPSLLSSVQSEEPKNSSTSRRSRRRHSLALPVKVQYDVPLEFDGGRSPHLSNPNDPYGRMHVQIQSCDLESGRIPSSAFGLAETPGSYHAGQGGDPLNRSDHTGYSSYSWLSDVTGRGRGSLHGLIVGFGNRRSASGDDLIVGFERRRRAMSNER